MRSFGGRPANIRLTCEDVVGVSSSVGLGLLFWIGHPVAIDDVLVGLYKVSAMMALSAVDEVELYLVGDLCVVWEKLGAEIVK